MEKRIVNVLAFDCSTQSCSVAVTGGGDVLAHRWAAMARGQAEALMPMIGEALAESGLDWSDLDLVAVTVGPGTFTGLRIGLAAARGMALAGNLPVAGVTTCEAVAHSVPMAERDGGRILLACIDGKRADVFVQAFDAALQPLSPPEAVMPEEAARRWPGPVLLAGDAAARLALSMPDAILSMAPPFPDARVVAVLGARHHAEGRGLPPHPLYLRPPDVTLPETAK